LSWEYAGKVKGPLRIPPFEKHMIEGPGGHSHGVWITEQRGYVVLVVVCDGSCHKCGVKESGFDAWARSVLAKYDEDRRPLFMMDADGSMRRLNANPFKKLTLRFAFPTRYGPGLQEMEVRPQGSVP
jgi:hypothetical protein